MQYFLLWIKKNGKLSDFVIKSSAFLRRPQKFPQSTSWFCAHFCGLLRKAELYAYITTHYTTGKPTTQLFFIALSAICLPFVTPALRRVCLPYVPATTTQLENILSALKYHGSKPGTKSKLVDIGNFLNWISPI